MTKPRDGAADSARLEAYFAERARTQAIAIQTSMAARQSRRDPARCEGEYLVTDR